MAASSASISRGAPRWREIVPLAIDLVRGNWHAGGVIDEHRGPELTIRSRRRSIRIMNDGDAMTLPTPLRYSIRRGALCVIAPSETKTG